MVHQMDWPCSIHIRCILAILTRSSLHLVVVEINFVSIIKLSLKFNFNNNYHPDLYSSHWWVRSQYERTWTVAPTHELNCFTQVCAGSLTIFFLTVELEVNFNYNLAYKYEITLESKPGIQLTSLCYRLTEAKLLCQTTRPARLFFFKFMETANYVHLI